MDFGPIASTKAETPWYSPGATGVTTADADLFMKRQAACSGGDLTKMEAAWLGEMFCGGHRVMFRVKSNDKDKNDVFLGLFHYSDSCVLTHKFRAWQVPGYPNDTWFEPILNSRPAMRAMFNIDDVVACNFEVLSPAGQRARWPRWSQTSVVRALTSSPFRPLKEVAAKAAFCALEVGFPVPLREVHEHRASEQGQHHRGIHCARR